MVIVPRYHTDMFKLHVHPDTTSWVPRQAQMEALQRFFQGTETDVYLHPRSEANKVLGRHAKPYAFRAFTRGKESHLFVDFTETPESVAWLMAHELCHRMVDQTPTLENAFTEARPKDLEPAGDAFHDVDPEERFCDGIATNLMGYRMDRRWWRQRTPPTQMPAISFGGIDVVASPAKQVFSLTQQHLMRFEEIQPGSFEAISWSNRGRTVYEIRASTYVMTYVMRALERAMKSVPRRAVRITIHPPGKNDSYGYICIEDTMA